MGRLLNAARKALGASNIAAGRESVSKDKLVAKYPDGICISGVGEVIYVDTNTGEPASYFIFTYAEEPDKYFSGSQLLNKLGEELKAEFEGDLDALNNYLAETYLRVKLLYEKTQKGKPFLNVILKGEVPHIAFSEEI